MNCADIEKILPLYAGDDLGGNEERAVAAHLRSCASCALLAEGYRRSQEILRAYEAPEFGSAFFEGVRSTVLEEHAKTAAMRLTLCQRARNFIAESLPGAGLLSSRAAGFAALFVAVALGLIFFNAQSRRQANESANGNNALPVAGAKGGQTKIDSRESPSDPSPEVKPAMQPLETGKVRKVERVTIAATPYVARRRSATLTARRRGATERGARLYEADVVPGEETYLDAISKLDEVIRQREGIISATLRAEYVRNLTDVDRAIADTRKAALKHRNDPQMTDFVFAAYRGKVVLLSEMAKHTQSPSTEF